MKNINNKFASVILVSALMLTTAACNNARTSTDAPANVNEEVKAPQNVEQTQQDATNPVRRNQLDSDIRAREERNKVNGVPEDRAESDLESEVRSKLEANIPGSKLTVSAKEEGIVTIVGSVPSQEAFAKIEPLAYQVLGVQDVNVDVKVVEPTQS
ncbi:BON domain-containing protein [Gloeocapsa sp. PCC 73106]|uniref:BON domain-containing protein n=1 Tax=Gloeocapsa sp. PCC 73106 TaxID=102232 RepID=UPI0002AD18D9|nr:BON domain-containing protein [Gloeocapsa sp. PCC 73106]ELR96403.1 putative periplasmic or secreted lipoprotein [Gloeocapsa sp. PCC 73106]